MICCVPYGAALVTIAYAFFCYVVLTRAPECGDDCRLSEGVDTSPIQWATDFLCAVIIILLGIHLRLSRRGLCKALTAFTFWGISFVFQGMVARNFGNSGTGDGKGTRGYYIGTLLAYFFATDSAMEFVGLTLRVWKTLPQDSRPRFCACVELRIFQGTLLVSLVGVVVGCIWCILSPEVLVQQVQDEYPDDPNMAEPYCVQLLIWSQGLWLGAYCLFWIAVACIFGTSALAQQDDDKSQQVQRVLGLPTSLAAAGIVVLQLLVGVFHVVTQFGLNNTVSEEVATIGAISFHYAMLMTAYFAHNLIHTMSRTTATSKRRNKEISKQKVDDDDDDEVSRSLRIVETDSTNRKQLGYIMAEKVSSMMEDERDDAKSVKSMASCTTTSSGASTTETSVQTQSSTTAIGQSLASLDANVQSRNKMAEQAHGSYLPIGLETRQRSLDAQMTAFSTYCNLLWPQQQEQPPPKPIEHDPASRVQSCSHVEEMPREKGEPALDDLESQQEVEQRNVPVAEESLLAWATSFLYYPSSSSEAEPPGEMMEPNVDIDTDTDRTLDLLRTEPLQAATIEEQQQQQQEEQQHQGSEEEMDGSESSLPSDVPRATFLLPLSLHQEPKEDTQDESADPLVECSEDLSESMLKKEGFGPSVLVCLKDTATTIVQEGQTALSSSSSSNTASVALPVVEASERIILLEEEEPYESLGDTLLVRIQEAEEEDEVVFEYDYESSEASGYDGDVERQQAKNEMSDSSRTSTGPSTSTSTTRMMSAERTNSQDGRPTSEASSANLPIHDEEPNIHNESSILPTFGGDRPKEEEEAEVPTPTSNRTAESEARQTKGQRLARHASSSTIDAQQGPTEPHSSAWAPSSWLDLGGSGVGTMDNHEATTPTTASTTSLEKRIGYWFGSLVSGPETIEEQGDETRDVMAEERV